MTAKLELATALFVLVIFFPLCVFGLRADIRSGETTFTAAWKPFRKTWKRRDDSSGFWQQIVNGGCVSLIVLVVGIVLLIDALQRL